MVTIDDLRCALAASQHEYCATCSRPPVGGIADGTGGFAQGGRAALRGNDGKRRWIRPSFEESVLAKDDPTG